MIIVSIKTDQPEAELGVFSDQTQLGVVRWQAHRQLAETIHQQLTSELKKHTYGLHDIEGIVCFAGPGSFTGLRIGVTVANALGYSLQIPVVSSVGEDWLEVGIQAVKLAQPGNIIVPEYGAPVHITQPKK